MYYNIGDTLSYNCLFNFVLGGRGVGKTYGFKQWAVDDFKKNGNEFIYLRRYDKELDKVKGKLFTDIQLASKYSGDKISLSSGNNIMINGEVAGYLMPLSTSQSIKSSSYPKVNKILFDEFIVDKGFIHYIKNEVEVFLDFYETIARTREVIVFFMANSISMINPYTSYFNLSLPYGSNVYRRNDILLQLVESAEFVKMKKETRFAKIIEGTQYSDYAIDNKFLRDNNNFLQKKTPKSEYLFTFIHNNSKYGVWADYTIGLMFVSVNIDPSCPLVYSMTLADHQPNTMLLTRAGQGVLFKKFVDNYKIGNVRFENQNIKSVVTDIIKWTY